MDRHAPKFRRGAEPEAFAAIESWGQKPRERLAAALRGAGAPAEMIERAERGYYGDFTSPLTFPITQLINDARAAGLDDIANRAMRGEFDG
jgi:hypothetical protein